MIANNFLSFSFSYLFFSLSFTGDLSEKPSEESEIALALVGVTYFLPFAAGSVNFCNGCTEEIFSIALGGSRILDFLIPVDDSTAVVFLFYEAASLSLSSIALL